MRYDVGSYRYGVVPGWGQVQQMGVVSGVACDSDDRVYVAVRTPPYPQTLSGATLVFDRNGKFLRSWGEDLFGTPHGIWASPDDEIYVTDVTDHTIRKYSRSGDLLMTLGTKDQPGAPGEPFNKPSRAVLSQSGELYVSDGYGQSRAHRLTPDGDVVVSWGAPGTGAGEFDLPHDVTVDKEDRVYILDRGNRRCQIFNNSGEYITEWGGLRSPNDLFIDGDGVIHVAEAEQRICLMTPNGEVIGRWGEKGHAPGQFPVYPHGLWIDSHGDVYVAEVGAENRLQKFARV